MAPVSESTGSKAVSKVDAETAIARIRERSERIAERECEQALGALRAQGEVSEEEAEAVAALAERLTDRVLAVPEEALRDTTDERTVRVALELFRD
jgi:glutamyl-tRNA reductase